MVMLLDNTKYGNIERSHILTKTCMIKTDTHFELEIYILSKGEDSRHITAPLFKICC